MSLRGIPFDTVLEQVMELSEGNHDITVPTQGAEYIAAGDGAAFGVLRLADGTEHSLTTEGSRTLMKRLGLPARYMGRISSAERAEHVNMWLGELDTSWYIRLNGQEAVRSIQPAGFTPVDVLPTLETIAPVIVDEGMVITHHIPNLDDFHLRVVWPESYGEGSDFLHAGFHMNGSESGRRPFTIDAACYRNVCLNSAILRRGRALFHQRLTGLNFDEFRPRLLEGLTRVRVVGRNLCNALTRCRTEHMPPEKMQGELQELLNMKVLPKRFAEQCIEAIDEGRIEEETRFGLVNLITREAQDFGGEGERKFRGRMRVENVAGKMLLPYMGTTIARDAVLAGVVAPPAATQAVAEVENAEDRMRAALGGFPEDVRDEAEGRGTHDLEPASAPEADDSEPEPGDDDLESLLGDSGDDDSLVPT